MKKLEYYEFSNMVKIISGDEDFSLMINCLKNEGAKKVFILTNAEIEKSEMLNTIINKIKEQNNLDIGDVIVVKDNIPVKSVLDKIYDKYIESMSNSILAVGDSSTISTAKVLKLRIASAVNDISLLQGMDNIVKKQKVAFGVVAPYFSSCGEITKRAEVYNDTTLKVEELCSELLQPDFCLINPLFTKNISDEEFYYEFIEMLAKNIESYISLKSNIMTKNLIKVSLFEMKQAIARMSEIKLSGLENEEDDIKFRYDMQRAGVIAGMAISNSCEGLLSAIVRQVVAKIKIDSKKIICALLLPWLKFNLDICQKEYAQSLLCIVGADEYCNAKKEEKGIKLIQVIKNFIDLGVEKYNVELDLKKLGLKDEMIDEIANKTLDDGLLMTNKKVVSKDDIVMLLNNESKEVRDE